ncbi:VOC family protein [Sphingomonadaceae bacterium G21617-S1]|nr:VOC family protein [Sphingomonadaceae bacterium G21617-S1]
MALVANIDHVAFAVSDLGAAVQFYGDVLGLLPIGEPYHVDGEIAVQRVGGGEILLSLHRSGSGAQPVATHAASGSLDICFEWIGSLDAARAHLGALDIEPLQPPAPRRTRDGAAGESLYFRDLDGNLIELMARV